MAKEWAQPFYKGKLWKRTRESYINIRLAIDGGLCEECHTNLGQIVHHKEKLTEKNIKDMGIAVDLNNLEYVCKECHDKFPGHGVNNKGTDMGFVWTDDGQPIPVGQNKVEREWER